MHQRITIGINNTKMHTSYMQYAINEAWKYQFLTYPNPAVGACIVHNGKILAIQAHKEAGMPHAEVNAVKAAFLNKFPNSKLKNLTSSLDIHNFLILNHNNFFHDKEIYVTLEPCNHIGKTPSCANLLKELKIKKVYIGMIDTTIQASGGMKALLEANIDVQYIFSKECNNLLYPFELWRKNKFQFFKMAMREDGTISGGYISTQKSLNLVHEIRTKIQLLIIGGNTVRIDRPKLDSRLSISKISSDILIYSNNTDFDKTISLFNIPNRKVIVSNNINKVKSNFTMIEGGYNLFEIIKSDIDMIMLFISHKEETLHKYDINKFNFIQIHSYFINEYDEIIFLKKKNEKI